MIGWRNHRCKVQAMFPTCIRCFQNTSVPGEFRTRIGAWYSFVSFQGTKQGGSSGETGKTEVPYHIRCGTRRILSCLWNVGSATNGNFSQKFLNDLCQSGCFFQHMGLLFVFLILSDSKIAVSYWITHLLNLCCSVICTTFTTIYQPTFLFIKQQ